MSARLVLCPVKLEQANAFVAEHHRHHKPVVGHKFSLGAVLAGHLVGVSIVSRPLSRMRDDGRTLEVSRLCTDGTRNACSFLYGASARACFALGYRRIGTYILASEPGASLVATGWRLIGERGGGQWGRANRPRLDTAQSGLKLLFELEAASMSARTPHMRERGAEGLACPLCGSTAMAVTDSRGRGGRIWRRRMCAGGHRFSTVEILDDGGRSAALNGLVALIDGLSPEDFAMVTGLAARLGPWTVRAATGCAEQREAAE